MGSRFVHFLTSTVGGTNAPKMHLREYPQIVSRCSRLNSEVKPTTPNHCSSPTGTTLHLDLVLRGRRPSRVVLCTHCSVIPVNRRFVSVERCSTTASAAG